MSSPAKLRVGVVGLGFMGRTHIGAWRSAAAAGWPNEITAVCDRAGVLAAGGRERPEDEASDANTPLFDRMSVKTFERPEDLFADSKVDAVSICTHTPTHVDLAIAALAAGKHVLLEKPVAIRSEDAERLSEAALRAKTLCMPAMCVRFWPGWDWLAERVRAGTFGEPKSVMLRRLGTRPGWSEGFYEDYARSGGALFDLHVHDADFVRFCFGAPRSVIAGGTLDHLTAIYRFARGPGHCAAEGGWDHSVGFPFKMSFTVAFENATADYDGTRERRLFLAHKTRDGGTWEEVSVEPITGWDAEVRHFADAVAGKVDLGATCGQAVALTRMLEAERRSLDSGAAVKLG